jgi:hypothetical protein
VVVNTYVISFSYLALIVIVLTAFVTYISSSAISRREAVCNPCGPRSQEHRIPIGPRGRFDYTMTKSKVSNSLDNLYKLLSSKSTQEVSSN